MQNEFDDIYNSLINGNFSQMVQQMDALGMHHFSDLVDYIAEELNQPEVALKICKTYFNKKA